MPVPGKATAVTMAGNTLRSMGFPVVVMRTGTPSGTWEIPEPGVAAVMEFYSTKPPEEVAAELRTQFANPKESEPGNISGPFNTEVDSSTRQQPVTAGLGTLLEGTVTFSVGPTDFDSGYEGPQPVEALKTMIGVQYFLNTRPLSDNTGIAELAARRLEDFVFTATTPLDEQGNVMERPSVAGQGTTELDQRETMEAMLG